MKTRITALLLFAFLIVTLVTHSQTVYVNSSSGSDATGNGSAGNPYKTFHKGYQMVATGQTLNLTGTYTWTDADETGDAVTSGYTINKSITIQGQGAGTTIVQAATTQNTADRRVFTLENYAITISGITVRYGKISTSSGNYGAGIGIGYLTNNILIENCNIEYNDYSSTNTSTQWAGGGALAIYNSSATANNLTIDNCNIRYNNCNTQGAAIYSYFSTGNCKIVLKNSTVNNNNSAAAGLFYAYYASYDIINTTLAYNSAAWIFMQAYNGNISFTNVTVAYNNLYYNSSMAVYLYGDGANTNYYIKNCVFAKNIRPNSTYGDYNRSGGTLGSITNNLVEITSGEVELVNGVNGNIVGNQACLGLNSSLNINGSSGITPTLNLESNSVAINSGTNVANGSISIPSVDQRGVSRVGATDMGAYEFTGTPTAPELTVSPSTLSGFSYYNGSGPSTSQSFTISGLNLIGNVVITPNANYEVSTGGAYLSTITLNHSGGTLTQNTVYVRLKAGLSTNTYNNLTLSITSPCVSKSISCSGVVMAVPASTRIWSGNTSTNWNTTTNWSSNTVPISTWHALIPGGKTNYPIVGNSKASPAACNNLTVENGATLTIDADKAITVSGNILNSGQLLIKSSASGDGSLLNTGTYTGTSNVERYLASGKWHLVSSPITAAQTSVFTGLYLRPYLEATDVFGPYIYSTTIPLSVGKGYSIWANSNSTPLFSGTPNNGTVGPLSIVYTLNGYNLVGNPYPSAIDWDAAGGWTKTNLAGTIYVWDPSGSGQYLTYNTTSGGTGSRYIAMGQGFFVQAIPGGGSLTMNNNIRVHDAVPFLKSEETLSDQINIKVSNNVNTYTDETIIALNDTASDSFDYDLDANKFAGETTAPMLYTMKYDKNLAVSCLSSI
ncbi:MAG: hypothetical protein HGB12_11415, partial [Bacteroidetes bacterium]|nr:hypothetical protein [Bacteroidota bacterium]